MLDSANELKGYALQSLDGELGRAEEFLFDDEYWTIRYLVAETGDWIPDRQVLISPYAISGINREARHIAIDLSRQRILDSPPLSSDEPVSRQYEESFYGYFQWPMYWGGGNMWGAYPNLTRDHGKSPTPAPAIKQWDAHLRSTRDSTGHHLQARDGEIGHVHDFIVDDETWAIRYLVIDTRNWWPGKKVLIAPQWIDRVSWSESKVFVHLNRDMIKEAPEYSGDTPITRDFETLLHAHYQQPGYWLKEQLVLARQHV